MKISFFKKLFAFCMVTTLFAACAGSGHSDSPRQKIQFDYGWKFTKGEFTDAYEVSFDDSAWKNIDVPHDWSITDTFSKKNPGSCGYASGGTGWYRKTFTLDGIPSDAKVCIEFGGVYMNSEVWINGHYLGKRPYGYISFSYDMTPYLNFKGENLLAVKVDNTKQPSARWYTGSGIYRHVWLVVTDMLHISRHGIVARTELKGDKALVKVSTSVENNRSAAVDLVMNNEIYSMDGQLVAKAEEAALSLKAGQHDEIPQEIVVPQPRLWSPDAPELYLLKTTLSHSGKVVDAVETTIGIREFEFSNKTGFSLNGVPMKMQGVNNHSDLGALGAAVNEQVLRRRLEILKEMGCNAIRTAHNPPCEELLDLCDSMGFMVMDEAFDEWIESWPFNGVVPPNGKARYGYHLYFNDWAEKDLEELIQRDRNHPSVILWSVGNEIPDACFVHGVDRLKKLISVVRKNDPTRPVTSGITHMHLANESGYASALDVTGYNGGGGSCFMYEKDHETYPERKMIATEVPHSFQTRGVYRTRSWYRGRNPLGGLMEVPDLTEEEVFTDVPKYYSSSYDNAMVRIGARDSWRRTRDLPYMCGEFRWTGFDYLGETMFGWPAKYWNFGIIDMCGFPKDTYYFYKSQWTRKPMVHIFPHWNWEGKEGVEIPVVAYSNCERVELFLNGKSLGEKTMGDEMDLVWLVPYQPGKLSAKAKTGGKVVAEAEIVTAGKPGTIQILPDKQKISTDRHDVVHLEVNILDENGNFVPTANNKITFHIEGDAGILGIDNGDPLNTFSFNGNEITAFNGKCLLILKSEGKKGKVTVTASSPGLESAETRLSIQ